MRSRAPSRLLLERVRACGPEPGHERDLFAGEPEEQPLPVDLDEGEEALATEVPARHQPDRIRLLHAVRPPPAHAGRDEDAHPREPEKDQTCGHLSPWMRSLGLMMSVTRMPNLSFTITASPRAMGLPLTRMSSGSPASFESSTTDPGASARRSRSASFVRPISTVTASGMSSSRSKLRPPASPIVSSAIFPPPQVITAGPVTRTALAPPDTPGAPTKRARPSTL